MQSYYPQQEIGVLCLQHKHKPLTMSSLRFLLPPCFKADSI